MILNISDRLVSSRHKPLVIAEIGINHGGSLEIAKAMVKAAARAGAEIIKHQTHIVDDEMSSKAMEVIPGNAKESIYEIMKRCALSQEDEYSLKEFTEEQGLLFLSTPFSRAALHRLEKMGVSAFKIGSGECNNYPLIEEIASLKKPVILSTGMNTIESVQKAVAIFKRHAISYALLHTTNLYPTPNRLVRLGAMLELAKAFPNAPYGLSDHTVSNHACFAAIALGASIVERHFTDTMQRNGPDIVCSMDEQGLKDLINGVEIIYQQRGGSKKPADEEQVTMNFAFASVVSIQDIEKNDVLTKENIWVKRPGIGEIPAERYPSLLGKRTQHRIKKDSHLRYNDILM